MTKGLVLVALLALSMTASAHGKVRLCQGFLPPNNMFYPESPTAGGIAKADFDEVLDKVQAHYGPIVAAKGGSLSIVRKWSDGTVNAFAERQGNTWIIEMYGGFARHPAVTKDGFMAVACHEMGHHIGGAPLYRGDWASIEGQSDYFSTLKCLRRIFEREDNKKVLDTMTLDPEAVRLCKSQHGSQQDELICVRSTMAGLSLAAVLADGGSTMPKLTTPDKSQVNNTYLAHPDAQCRLDTLFEAALCKVPFAQDVSDSEYKVGACYTPDHSRGARPRCWFKPN
jgi:hypothetical protein